MTYENKDLYQYAGISLNHKNELSVRYTNKLGNRKLSALEPKMVELPNPMSRKEALRYIIEQEIFTEKEKQVISDTILRRDGKYVKKKNNIGNIPNSVFDLSRTVFLSKR